MLAKPLRTYQRKPAKSTFIGFKWPVVQIEKHNVETSHPLKNSLDDSLNDPFETTFDRIAKGAVVPPRPPDTNQVISWDSSSSNNDSNKSCDVFDHVSPTLPTCNNTSRFTRSITHSNTNNISWKYRNPTKCKREVAAPKKKVSVRKRTTSTSKDKIKEESKQSQKTQGRKKQTSRRSKQGQLKESRNLRNKERLHVYSDTVSIPEDAVQKKDISCNSKESRSESVLTIDGTSRTESTGSDCSVADSKYVSNCARDIRPCFVKLNARAVQHWYTLHRNKSLKDEQDACCNTAVLRADTSEADQTSLTIKKTDAQSISLEGDNAVRSFKDALIKSCYVVLDSSIVKDWILRNKRSVYSIVAAEDKQNSRSLSETAARDSDILCPYVTKRNRGKLAKSGSAKQARTKEAVEEDDAASMPRRKRSIISSTPIKKRVRLNGFPVCSVLLSPIDGSLPVLDTMSKYSMKDDVTEDDRVNFEHSEVHSPSSRTAFGNSGITCAKVECKSETPGSQPISQSVIDISIEISKNFKDEATKVDKYDIPDEADGVHTVLMGLENPIRITVKRKQYVKWQLSASDIFESVINDSSIARSGEASAVETSATKSLPSRLAAKAASNSTQPCDNGAGDKRKEKKIFLKSGKNWTRSLSILTNINNETENLDRMSVGKGKKWRASVRDVFDMQRQGVLQSCLRIDEDATNLSRDTLDVSDVPSSFGANKRTALNSTNHARLSKRISMRVVPNSTTAKCDMKDTAFLEAFGIIEEKSKLSHREKSPVPSDTLVDRESEIARKVVLQKCSQNRYLPFSKCFPNSYLEHCHKIGEGVYGEVFLYERDGDKSVLKIIPIEGNELVNGEPQKKFHEILSEIVIAKELANLKSNAAYRTDGFVEVKDVNCIVGKYPKKLVELWNIYDDNKTSDNDCPSMFGKNQLYIALELSHGGQDLEAFVFPTAEEACAVFLQIALALAVGEKALEFEHRDLHWGNVLISRTKEPYVYYTLGEKEIELPSKGMKVSIIDFTLSRMSYQGCCIYNDLSLDPALFTAHGDYQFDIYRLMRDKIGNDWRQFEPHTNVLWLHYTLDKMITAVRYEKKSTKTHKSAINKLRELKNTVLQYRSAFDFVINSDSIESACSWRKEKCLKKLN